MSLKIITDSKLLEERNQSKNTRVGLARNALKALFGSTMIKVHAGSGANSAESDGTDMTHWLYITITLKKRDTNRRNQDHKTIRAEVIKTLQEAGVPLYTTSYHGPDDEYAISIEIEK
jgi:hypothetical protein